MKLLSITSIVLVSLSVLSGCFSPQSAEPLVSPSISVIRPSATFQITAVSTPRPIAIFTPTIISTPVPSYTPSATVTSTPFLTNTATITTTSTPDRVLPGIYVGSCTKFRVGYFLNVDFCVDQVDVLSDYSMNFYLSWTFHLPFTPEPYFEPYWFWPSKERMYLIDNLGKKYGPIAEKYYHHPDITALEGHSQTAVISFSPVQTGAKTITFYDDAFHTSITIPLRNPIHVYDYLLLKHSPFSLRYQIKYWQMSTTEDGMDVLTHLTIQKCTISEVFPSESKGKLINTLDIGSITYNIYRSYEQDMSVRMYEALAGLEGIDPLTPPLLRVTIPLDNPQQCILDASEVVAHLQPSASITP